MKGHAKNGPENDFFSYVPFCLHSLVPFERCESIYLPTPVDFKTLPVDLRNFLALEQHHSLLLLLWRKNAARKFNYEVTRIANVWVLNSGSYHSIFVKIDSE